MNFLNENFSSSGWGRKNTTPSDKYTALATQKII